MRMRILEMIYTISMAMRWNQLYFGVTDHFGSLIFFSPLQLQHFFFLFNYVNYRQSYTKPHSKCFQKIFNAFWFLLNYQKEKIIKKREEKNFNSNVDEWCRRNRHTIYRIRKDKLNITLPYYLSVGPTHHTTTNISSNKLHTFTQRQTETETDPHIATVSVISYTHTRKTIIRMMILFKYDYDTIGDRYIYKKKQNYTVTISILILTHSLGIKRINFI